MAREEFGKCLVRVLQTNRWDAWATDSDSPEKQAARVAWLELLMLFNVCYHQALRSFEHGKGPGPDGLRADFLRLLLESPGGKRDGQGQAIPLSQDARPIVMGTTWRKLCFKTTFLLDKVRIQERLAPQQFAVGVRSGAEAMIHATRAWLRLNSHRRDYVLLQRDVSNAFNSVHTHMFLDECYRFAHASSKFAEFCYGVPSHLVYHGRCMQSARGQQGCPLMGPLFCLARKRMYEEACANVRGAAECFDPEFADDGFCGGPISLVWAIFEQELALAGKYGLHFDLSKTKLHILAGDDFQGDLRPFTALGINIIKGTNVQMLQVPLIGPTSLYDEWNRTKVGDLDQALTAIETLPHKHISLHLMKQCLSFPKLAYYA
ncbi:RvY_04325-1, partial [Symbiodinium natans]